MLFKVVSGVSADIYQLWSSSDTLNEDKTEALNVNSSFRRHYKNRLVPNWKTASPKEARVALYKDDNELLSMVFNASNSDNENWFSKNRMIFSPWTDLKDEYAFYFSIIGRYRRFFYISKPDATCSGDDGWLMSTYVGCAYESRFPEQLCYTVNCKQAQNGVSTKTLASQMSCWCTYVDGPEGANDSLTTFFQEVLA
ncbi:Saccharopine dehydrogenase [Desmophyllum pertusum]|uniref:Saccharopine dehydrogenase n=1 Tax=Desmophyllum pertusum TaxID=174260 RepID=A0A9W9YC41_9CNID|nr:Saccharopine dehydrogenase [Desmophyllum pertusum]